MWIDNKTKHEYVFEFHGRPSNAREQCNLAEYRHTKDLVPLFDQKV